MNTRSKGIIGITLALIMIASIFAVIPSTVAEGPNPDAPAKTPTTYPNSTIRIYGEAGYAPDRIYDDWDEPFDPTEIPKDSLTFNPAILVDMGQNAPSIDMDLKTDLRMWYEPAHVYEGLLDEYTLQDMSKPTLMVEYTYIFVNNKHKYLPQDVGIDGVFWFPIAEKAGQTGLGAYNTSPGVTWEDGMVTVTTINGSIAANNKTTNGTIQIEKLVTLAAGETVQFLDHKMTFVGTDIDGTMAVVDIKYAGNANDDSLKRVILSQKCPIFYYFDRHNVKYTAPKAPDRTWKVCFEFKTQAHQGMFHVGKLLSQGDTFYVDGVRYDIPAIEVIDTNGDGWGDRVKYITIRTPLPKCAQTGITPVRDDTVVSSQWIDCIAPSEIVPLLPPFNMQHDMVDDIDIPLWAPTKHQDKWPTGDSGGVLGQDYFPDGERYLTQQYPPVQWLKKFRAVPAPGGVRLVRQGLHATTPGTNVPCDEQEWEDYGGPYYPGDDVPDNWTMATCGKILDGPGVNYSVFNVTDWIAIDVEQRIIPAVEKTDVYYVSESKDPRYSTDLLEKLNESYIGTDDLYENWTKFDIQSLPDRFTEFVVPQVPDLVVDSCFPPYNYTQTIYGDYLVTTSWIAPNARGDFPDQRVAFSYDQLEGMGGIDIYVNDMLNTGNNTVRVYGEAGIVTAPAYGDDNWEAPFNPTWIRKDSITFDPAILEWDGQEYPMSAQSTNIDLKKYLRLWYEPCYQFSQVKKPAVVLESTYMLIDSKHKKPWHGSADDTWFAFPIAENESTTQVGLELFENVEGTPFERNVVALSMVGNMPALWDKTTDGVIRIEKTYRLADGEKIQFLDHKLEYDADMSSHDNATVILSYAGNKDDDDFKIKILPKSRTIFYDRHHNASAIASHPKWTWYVHFVMKTQDNSSIFVVGKELARGDIFYVDAVRYEVEAIEVINWDTVAKFKYLTIRTPFPKELTGLPFCDPAAKLRDDNTSVATSIWIATIPPCHTIPVNPPFNMVHKIVDDTDVQLWVPLKHFDKWPLGDPLGTKNIEYFPDGEEYLTMQEPGRAWLKFFRAVPVGVKNVPCDWQLWDNYGGPFYPTQMGKTAEEQWIANDVRQRVVGPIPALDFCWMFEDLEPRYSTNLLQILNESFNASGFLMNQSWTKFDIQTLPDQFTEFRLPEIPDVVINHYPCDQLPTRQYDDLQGSYLVTTSFIAPNAEGDLNLNQSYTEANRFAFIYDNNLSANLGLYVNEDPVFAEPTPVTTISLKAGWNLISLNVLPENRYVDVIFGHEIWTYDPASGWQTPSVVKAGTGYFVYSEEDATIALSTENSEEVELTWEDLEATLGDGWNLVGPGLMQIPVPSDRYVYQYKDNDYTIMYPADALDPGAGYWVLKMPTPP